MTTIKNIIADEKKRLEVELKIRNKLEYAVAELITETKDQTSLAATARLTGEYSINLSVWTKDNGKFASITIKKGVAKAAMIIASPDTYSNNMVNCVEYELNIKDKVDLDKLYNMIKEL